MRAKKIFMFVFLWVVQNHSYGQEVVENQSLSIGVIPYTSARVLVATYEPMRIYLERSMGVNVSIFSASGFKQYLKNAQNGDYDLIISSGNLARILQKDNQFKPILRYGSGGSGLLVVPVNSPIKKLSDLQGKKIAVPDSLSLVSIASMTYLRENDMYSGKDYIPLEVPSFASAILSIQKEQADAAISASAALKQMPKELRDSVRIVATTDEFISQVFMIRPQISAERIALVKGLLMKFANDTADGSQFLANTGFISLLPVTERDMATMDRYMAESRRLLAEDKSH